MKIAVVGGGPAGLYFAILMKKADSDHEITVFERNAPDNTFGWGVVFSEQTLGNLEAADPESYDVIADHFARWDDIDVHFRGTTTTSGGHGFVGIARQTLLDLLRRRAASLGVRLHYGCEIADDDALAGAGMGDADLIVAADGVNSAIRRKYASVFEPELDVRTARYIWLGTTRLFDAFTFIVIETPAGVFQAHAYRFDETRSAFIVECDEQSWRAVGFDRMNLEQTIAAAEEMFAPWLDGHPLLSNAPPHQREHPWLSFVRVRCARWHHGNIVLIGDAAHTAHFSIGSGTKLAMEDAIGLARVLSEEPDLERALSIYEEERGTEALRLQNAARNSMLWFENVRRYVHLDPPQFAYSLLTRSQRVSHENLRLRDREWLEGVERWFWKRATNGRSNKTAPPMFAPFKMREMSVENRITVSPMATYSAVDGTPNDFHFVHLGERALGGAGLVFTEMTCVSPEGRISPGCTGMWNDEHVAAWKRIVDFVHVNSKAKICLQLGHSGGKGSTRLGWEGDNVPLTDGNWPVMSASDMPWSPENQVPRPMTRADMDAVRDQFVAAVRMGLECGFDMVELHAAHGYLLSSFITPLQNNRTDEYGGSLENRLRYPLEVFAAMRAAWPSDRPMSIRISATDWAGENGITPDDAVEIGEAFAREGADLIDVSAGQTWAEQQPVYGRMFQTPFSDKIRNEGRLATMAVGNIYEPDHANSILAAGRADLVALARPHLIDPFWTLRAAAALDYRDVHVPPQYLNGMAQLARNLKREAEAAAALRV